VTGVVVDANVILVAQGENAEAGEMCERACILRLTKLREEEVLVIDESGLIFDEYFKRLDHAGYPGLGKAFIKWAYDNQYREERVERVNLTPIAGWRCFQEFPDDADLERFDADDKKYVAVALKSANNAIIVNATDSDWKVYKRPLSRHVTVVELCE
jgi:hypothetical protein